MKEEVYLDDVYASKPAESIHRRNLQRIETDVDATKKFAVPETSLPPNNPAWYTADGLHAYEQTVVNKSWYELLVVVFPILSSLNGYNFRETFPKDLVAGLTVGCLIIPQSLSYAKIAGMPVQYGLYSALIPLYAYSVFGTSRQLSVGPESLVALVVGTGVTKILTNRGVSEDADDYTDQYVRIAIQLSFLGGLLYLILGFLRLGFITVVLSHPVVSGFITASSIVIGCTQLKYLFGYSIPPSFLIYEVFRELVRGIDKFNWKTFVIGICSIILLVFFKKIGNYVPKLKFLKVLGPLTVTIIGIILNVIIDFPAHGIPVVGKIPKGLPDPTINLWTPIESFSELLPVILTVALVGYMGCIAVAKSLAAEHKYQIQSSTELISLGMANFLGSMAGSFPTTGSFSRSAVNNDSGAVTQVAGLVTGTIVLFVLLFLTAIFQKVPLACLGAIVIVAVSGLAEFEEAVALWKIDKFDFLTWVISFLGMLFLGIEIGLLIAVGVSLLLVLYESAYPRTAVLGRLPGTLVYRSVKQYPEAETFGGLLLVRVYAPIYFANVENIRDKLLKYERLAEEKNFKLKYIIFELSPVAYIDTSALHVLEDTINAYKHRDIELIFSDPSVRVMDRFVKSGFVDHVGRDHVFVTVHDAVTYALRQLDIAESGKDIQNGVDVEKQDDAESEYDF